jgi:hypothetical protein
MELMCVKAQRRNLIIVRRVGLFILCASDALHKGVATLASVRRNHAPCTFGRLRSQKPGHHGLRRRAVCQGRLSVRQDAGRGGRLREHLERVLQGVEEAIASRGTTRERLLVLVETYTQKSAQSRRRHMIAMQDVKYLPKPKQAPLIELQRKLTDRVTDLLKELNPNLPDDVYKPYTMMLIGMLNWTDMWYRTGGTMKPQELCDRMSRLFLKGFMAEKA